MAPVPGSRIGRPDSTIWGLPQETRRHSWAGSSGFANWTWSSLRSGTANSATTSTSEIPTGSLWSSTPLMTVSRLPWMNCAAANSPTKSYWTGRSSWDWGHTSHGESYDSLGDLAGPETERRSVQEGLWTQLRQQLVTGERQQDSVVECHRSRGARFSVEGGEFTDHLARADDATKPVVLQDFDATVPDHVRIAGRISLSEDRLV